MTTQRRQSRFRPDPARHTAMQITDRDLGVIFTTLHHPFLTIDEIRQLHFSVDNGRKSAARRLHILWNAGFLKRQWIPTLVGSSPAIYTASQAGVQLLLEAQRITPEELPSNGPVAPTTMRHELNVNKFVTAVMVGIAERYGLCHPEASPTRRLDLDKLSEVLSVESGSHLWDYVANPDSAEKSRHPHIPIRPDRLFTLKTEDGWKVFFLEVEIAAKSQARFRRRIRGYRAYYSSDGFLRRYGQGEDRSQYPFCVLITAPTEERRNNLIELAIKEKTLRMCWFAVYDEAVADPLGQVWIRPEEYASAIAGLSEQDKTRMYRTHRRVERDAFIRQNIRRFSILEG
jgi:hypothetical protein